MARCPSCDYPLPEDRERLGARCPNCRDPLYEPPGRASRPAREGESACPAHPGREAVGTCPRCGNYLCEACRTPWRGAVLCAACVDRALESREATPEQARAHSRQAFLALSLGGSAWLLTVAMAVVGAAMDPGNPATLGLAFLVLLLFGTALLSASLGLGQAVAALRTRGSHMILATIGLILAGLHLGAFIGLFSFSLWSN
jgi:hypothetical protein